MGIMDKKILAAGIAMFMALFPASAQVSLSSEDLRAEIDGNGNFSSIQVCGEEVLTAASPIAVGCNGGDIVRPAVMKLSGKKISLRMEDGKTVILMPESHSHSITFEVSSCPSEYDALILCPVSVKMHDTVGEVVGVARGEGLAFGMQALNIKTLAGLPEEYSKQFSSAFYQGNDSRSELSVGTMEAFRLAAVQGNESTIFQFFCRNRSRLSYRRVNNLDDMMVLPVKGPDASIAGSKVAMFGSRAEEALARIGEIEVEEGLPHPMFDGEWGKTSRKAMKSYLITELNEENLDFVLEKAKKAGFEYIYHPGPFEDWGHFNFSKSFAKDGDEGVRRIVERAAAQGIKVGVHTLTNFTTTNDAYVTPVPTEHLLKQGKLELLGDLDASQTEITIKPSGYFSVPVTLNAMQIDDELITYSSVDSTGSSYILKGCKRGAFGTSPASHSKSEPLYKLWDYPYRTFFPDMNLQDSYSDRLAEIFNKTGLCQISFDGLEGCRYTGHEDYAESRFVSGFWNQLDHNVVNDASRLNHFDWHINTRMNWGEPWGEEMRTGQVENRIKNQAFFRRNLFPRMLGWFLIRLADRKFECSTLEDLEWALSESAGFDGGYAMTIDIGTLKGHGQIDVLLDAIKNWDLLRENQAFSKEQMSRLKDPATEWHLEKVSEKDYDLYPLYISKRFHCDLSELQPGQPGGSDWSWDNSYAGKFAFRMKVEDGTISNPSLRTSEGTIKFNCEVGDGQYLVLDSDGHCMVTDINFNKIADAYMEGSAALPAGSSAVSFSCDVPDGSKPLVTVRYITRGKPERITLK